MVRDRLSMGGQVESEVGLHLIGVSAIYSEGAYLYNNADLVLIA